MKALLLIECQNEWLSPQGKLYAHMEDKQRFNLSASNIKKALEHARKVKIPIAHVGLRFQPGYPELANGKAGLNKAIPMFGTFLSNGFGSQFFEDFQPQANEFIVSGRTGASGFSGSNLDIWLRNNKIEDIYLTGYATHVCVESTLREAHDRGYHPILLEDATAAFNQVQQDHVIKEVVHHFGTHLKTNEFINLKK